MSDDRLATAVATCPIQSPGREYAAFEHEPMYEFFSRARPVAPIFHSEEIGYWVVTRRDDALNILRDHAHFSAEIATQPVQPWPRKILAYLQDRDFTNEAVQVACDPPRHTRIRQIAARFLNIRQFSLHEDQFRQLVTAYLDRIAGQSEADLVDAIFYEFPAQVVFLLLGETGFDPRKIKRWGDLRLNMIWGKPTTAELEAGARDLADFWDYTVNLVEARKKDPGDDYPSFLLARRAGDDSILTENEIRSLVFGLLLAGHETTTNAAGNITLELLRHPQQWRRLVADPSLIPNAVEEGLRYASSVVAWRRTAREDVVVAGQALPKGSKILIALASANRDEAHFDGPEAFDVQRGNARDHLSFGNGIHACLGAPLARLELRILVEELTRRFPNMNLLADQPIEWTRTISFRGPDKLWVRLHG
ncbi:MAG: cytochrome P450 [Rhodobacteraceae bacterium]|nr:cytochrome P450 [Paracoccaceae bacterium]